VPVLLSTGCAPVEDEPGRTTEKLDLAFEVKEVAGTGTTDFPVTVMVPLAAEGYHLDPGTFRLLDSNLQEVPAQFEAANHWMFHPNEPIRHLKVQFQATVPPFTTSRTGIATYTLRNDAAPTKTSRLSVADSGTVVTVDTGVLRATMKKSGFNGIDELWCDVNGNGAYESFEQFITSDPLNGGNLLWSDGTNSQTQRDSDFTDSTVTVEEAGPMRAVIKMQRETVFNSTTDHQHGVAVRLYFYADKPFVKVDYQLQNSARNVAVSWPLYFDSLDFELRLAMQTNPLIRWCIDAGGVGQRSLDQGLVLAQESQTLCNVNDLATATPIASGAHGDGWLDVTDAEKGVMAYTRHFWQMFPNGIEVDGQNKLAMQLFPSWSGQQYNSTTNPLYWLEDMQYVYKEMYFWFHGPSTTDTELKDSAGTFQYPPVCIVPTSQYYDSKADVQQGGVIPNPYPITIADKRKPSYGHGYGWQNFGGDSTRKRSCNTGDWPSGGYQSIATENPNDVYECEQMALGDLNCRPESMTNYSDDVDWPRLELTENSYCCGSWRRFKNNIDRPMAAAYLPGTGWTGWYAVDMPHGWVYCVPELYQLTGNLWARDWCLFFSEFVKSDLEEKSPFVSNQPRSWGHDLQTYLECAAAVDAADAIDEARTFVKHYIRKWINPRTGNTSSEQFHEGYVIGACVSVAMESNDPQVFAEALHIIAAYTEQDVHGGNYEYTTGAGSSGTGLVCVDGHEWYYLHTGKAYVASHVEDYFAGKLGAKPYGYTSPSDWDGGWTNRYRPIVVQRPRLDARAPSAITDLSVVRTGGGLTLRFTAPPEDSLTKYHVVVGTRPLTDAYDTSTTVMNWWAAEPYGPSIRPRARAKESITIPNTTSDVYVAVFTFRHYFDPGTGQSENMSPISNVVSVP
jgi:hypothetical protein